MTTVHTLEENTMSVLHTIIGSPHSGERIYARPRRGLTGSEGIEIQRQRKLSTIFALIVADLGPASGGIYRS